jgi:hypothetical protein
MQSDACAHSGGVGKKRRGQEARKGKQAHSSHCLSCCRPACWACDSLTTRRELMNKGLLGWWSRCREYVWSVTRSKDAHRSGGRRGKATKDLFPWKRRCMRTFPSCRCVARKYDDAMAVCPRGVTVSKRGSNPTLVVAHHSLTPSGAGATWGSGPCQRSDQRPSQSELWWPAHAKQ